MEEQSQETSIPESPKDRMEDALLKIGQEANESLEQAAQLKQPSVAERMKIVAQKQKDEVARLLRQLKRERNDQNP